MIQSAGLGVGGLLRSRREELGQDTDSVSRQLRIRAIYIRAIEEGRIQDLPGTAYAVGFVRTYADFLGFDGNSVVASFRDELGQRGRPETVSWQIEDKDAGFPFGRLLIVLVVIAAAGYGLWYYLANTQSGTGLIEAVPEYLKKSTGTDKTATPASGAAVTDQSATSTADNVPATAGTGAATATSPTATPGGNATEAQASTTAPQSTGQQAGTTPGTTTQTPATSTTATTTGTQPAGSASATANGQTAPAGAMQPASPSQAAANGSATQPATTGQVAANATAQSATGQPATAPVSTAQAGASQSGGDATPDVAAAATSSTTRISVRAKLESWVQINDKDGKPVLSRVLRAGETYAVPDEKGLVMNTGNAGGIEVVVDGKTLPSLGSVGLVKRNIVLDPDKLVTGNVSGKAPGPKDPATDGTTGVAPTGD